VRWTKLQTFAARFFRMMFAESY